MRERRRKQAEAAQPGKLKAFRTAETLRVQRTIRDIPYRPENEEPSPVPAPRTLRLCGENFLLQT